MSVKKYYNADARNGGTDGAMDSIPYADLLEGDACFVVSTSQKFVLYQWDASSTDTEDGDLVIRADDDLGGNGRWLKIEDWEANVDYLGGRAVNKFLFTGDQYGADMDDLVTPGNYYLNNTISNGPSTSSYYGQCLVLRVADTVTQIIFDYSTPFKTWFRSANPTEAGGSGSWGSWYNILNTSDTPYSSGSTSDTAANNLMMRDVNGNCYLRDIYAHRLDTTGVIFLGNQTGGSRYLYYNGTYYTMPGADLYVNGVRVPIHYYSTSGPSGGVDGDLWFQYT